MDDRKQRSSKIRNKVLDKSREINRGVEEGHFFLLLKKEERKRLVVATGRYVKLSGDGVSLHPVI